MKHATITTILIIALFSVVNAQTINNQTFAQMVENANGQMKDSVRSILKNDSHIWLAEPISQTGHSYLSFNSLGKSSLTPAQVMNAIKADPSSAFPYFNADGECGQRVKKGNEYSLNINVAGFKPIENPVQVTDVGSYHFTFSTLPNHTLEGSATHGVFKDGSGELWLFQVGKGVANEAAWKQKLNYIAAEEMWSQMADNVKDMMSDIKPSDQNNDGGDIDSIFSVRQLTDTEIKVCKGDSISIVADGEITVDYLGNFTAGPNGFVYPIYAAYNYKFAARCNHGSLIALVMQDDEKFEYACVGSSGNFTSGTKGKIQLLVNDSHYVNNSGAFRVRVKVKRSK